jgi:hypothetical protein
MGIASVFSLLLLVGIMDDKVHDSRLYSLVSTLVWAVDAVLMIFCMKERARVPTRTTIPTRSNGPSYQQQPIDEPEIAPTETLDDPSELPVDIQVERISAPNGNETIITTRTFFLPDGTRRVVKTIETMEDAD